MRLAGEEPFNGPIKTRSVWQQPVTWNRKAMAAGRRDRVFTCSMSDFFHPGADEWRNEAWEVIGDCTNLDWLILTKRPELIADRLPADWKNGYPNVWLGVTVENQDYLHRVDVLGKIPAASRFVSAEPLLGPVKFGRRLKKLDWVITGAERAAKNKRRPMDDAWVRAIRDECDCYNVVIFHKQRYEGTKLVFDGVVDGEIRQAWPPFAA